MVRIHKGGTSSSTERRLALSELAIGERIVFMALLNVIHVRELINNSLRNIKNALNIKIIYIYTYIFSQTIHQHSDMFRSFSDHLQGIFI
jgi:hypothetical protein